MSEHNADTFSGFCQDCRAIICVGSRCVLCATKSLLRADARRRGRQRLLAAHGNCYCGDCLIARGEERIERAEVA